MLSKISEIGTWAMFIISFGIIVYKTNCILGIVYTIIMIMLWLLLIREIMGETNDKTENTTEDY